MESENKWREKVRKANKISKLTKNRIVWKAFHYSGGKQYSYLVVRYFIVVFGIKFCILEKHDSFITTIKKTLSIIPFSLKYIFYSKIENNKLIKEHNKIIKNLEDKQLLFE